MSKALGYVRLRVSDLGVNISEGIRVWCLALRGLGSRACIGLGLRV